MKTFLSGILRSVL